MLKQCKFYFLTLALMACSLGVSAQKAKSAKQVYKPIETAVPVRPAGQKDVLNLTTPKMDVVRVAFVGVGARGGDAVRRWTHIDGVKIIAICDVRPEYVTKAQKYVTDAGLPKAAEYSGGEFEYKKLCERPDIDLVYICTDWKHHTPVALYAMQHGKNVAIEVPAATSLKECWDLINMSEKTRKHCMMLENCCYDFFEITALNMAQKGLFGEVIHTEGSYFHPLDDFWKQYWNNWRMDFNEAHRGDVYPTHGFGPDCQVMNIHRGDRLTYLVSMDTKPINGPKQVKQFSGRDAKNFQNGDQTSTLIRTALGKTILVQHDVMTTRPYNRSFQIVGTDGYAGKYPIEQLCFRKSQIKSNDIPNYDNLNIHGPVPDSIRIALMKKYEPQFVKDIEAKAKSVGGHGGMDFIMDSRLVYCLRNGLPLDMDVYDLAEWCCVGELSSISLNNNSAPVAIPDFTRGAWNKIKGFSYAFAK
jgi:predicted dehydrogenase